MSERRGDARKPIAVFFNKYVDGRPQLCRAMDISRTGLQALSLGEPETYLSSFSLEVKLPGERQSIWVWARRVREQGRRQAFEFVNLASEDEHRLERFIATYRAA